MPPHPVPEQAGHRDAGPGGAAHDGDGPATINRPARQRQVTLTANLTPGTSQAAVAGQIGEAEVSWG